MHKSAFSPTKNRSEIFESRLAHFLERLEKHPLPNLISFEFKCPHFSLINWLKNQSDFPKFYWTSPLENQKVATLGILKRFSYPAFIEKVPEEIAHFFKNHPVNTKLYGGFFFNPTHHPKDSTWENFHPIDFFLPEIECIDSENECTIKINIYAENSPSEKIKAIWNKINFNSPNPSQSKISPPTLLHHNPQEFDWNLQINSLKEAFKTTALKKVVMARKTTFSFASPFQFWDYFENLSALNSNGWNFAFENSQKSAFFGTSPELLFKRRGQQIISEAVAGTRPRRMNLEKDLKLSQDLQKNPKDLQEHEYVSEHIFKALNENCKNCSPKTNPSIRKLSQVQHLFSTFSGELNDNIQDFDLIKNLYPTPAVAGHPQKEALKKIREIERFNRGWYAGGVGVLSKNQSELAVAIRSAFVKNHQLQVFTGSGIVSQSDAQSEWEELNDKIKTFTQIWDHETT